MVVAARREVEHGGPAGPADGAGWASESLERSLERTFAFGIGVSQLPLLAAVASTLRSPVVAVPLVGAHLVLVVLALLTVRRGLRLWPLSLALPAVILADWLAAPSLQSGLAFGALWLCHAGQLVSAIGLRGRSSLLAAALLNAAVPMVVGARRPDWVGPLLVPTVLTGLGIQAGCRMLVPRLLAFVGRIDDEERQGWEARRRLAAARTASADAADHARTLHDSAINTLAAVASGGAAVRDRPLVRERCRRDLAVLEALERGTVDAAGVPIDDLARGLGLRAEREGMDDDDLARLLAPVPPATVRALRGAVTEALLNVAKHAGTDLVRVRLGTVDGDLHLEVADDGVGFDGAVVAGRGLAESVIARSAAAGVQASVRSAPGTGTVVALRCPVDGPPPGEEGGHRAADLDAAVAAVRDRGCWLWTLGTVAIGVVIEVASRPLQLSATYGMLAVVGALGLLSWTTVGHHGRLSPLAAAAVIAGVPAAHLLAMAPLDLRAQDLIAWQAIGVVPLLVILHAFGSGRLLALGIGALVATSAATVVVRALPLAAAVAVLVGTTPAVLAAAAWVVFHHQIGALGRRAAAAHRAAAAARLEEAARAASMRASERWRQAGLAECRRLLAGLASGALDVDDPEIRRACAEEEAFLRQVMLLDPDLFRLGPWLAACLSAARSRHVQLTVRTGGHDVDDDRTAARLGRLVTEVVDRAPAGSEVTVGLFASRGHLCYSVLGPLLALTAVAARWQPPTGWTVEVQGLGDTGVVEVTGPVTQRLLEVTTS